MRQQTCILVVALLVAAVVAQAQQARQGHRIGVLLYDGAPPGLPDAFGAGLQELGYVDGNNLTLEWRDAGGNNEQLAALAEDFVRLKVDLIVAVNTPAALAAKRTTTTIPIVITRVANPVESGLVADLARPGGNVTGVSSMHAEFSGKRVEFVREILPGLSRVVVLFNADNPGQTPQIVELEQVSAQLGLAFLPLPVRGPSDFPEAFQAATQARAEALFVLDDTTLTNHRTEILRLAAQHALSVVSRYKEYVEAGGLLAYGPTLLPVYRRVAYYVDRILKGATPSDLPIEQPMYFELVINLKTAQAFGLTIPPMLLFQANKVIR
jgi:putative tryptophan/tyrosine transport system substrate-binding protein